MKSWILILGTMVSLVFPQPSGREIMVRVDAQPEPESAVSKTTLTLIAVRRGKEKQRQRQILRYQRNYKSGVYKSKSLIRFLKPIDVKGTGFLMWEYRDGRNDDQWLFLPALGKVKRIAARQKSEQFMGTDFSYEDLAGREVDDDEYELLGEEDLEGVPCYRVQAVPLKSESAYSRRIVWVDRRNWVVVRIEFFDHRDRLLKVLEIPERRRDGPYWSVLRMQMENVQNQHRTIMEIGEIEYDTGLRDDYFTERFLMRIQ